MLPFDNIILHPSAFKFILTHFIFKLRTKSSLTPKLSVKIKVKISKSEGKNTWFVDIEKKTERKMT
jgi:hypothetical protein